jgi:S-adenosylmethionine:tRNA ribosyltransferase-isomerase
MVVRTGDPAAVEHRVFTDLPDFLRAGDLLVLNSSWVVPARFFAVREDTSGKVEGLFLKPGREESWEALLQAGGRMTPGLRLRLLAHDRSPSKYALHLMHRIGDRWLAEVREGPEHHKSHAAPADILAHVGVTPLPPYILSARRHAGEHVADVQDRAWYQAVYADPRDRGSVAAPTAGLHFTPGLLETLAAKGVARADVALHVGPGTFKPVQTEFVEQHAMHPEWFRVPASTIAAVEATRARRGRIIPVGTTSVRALESLPDPLPESARREGVRGETRLLITPGFGFRWNDALLTNFHLPGSTLMALVAARLPGGVTQLLDLYRRAISERYRFYSYGDAMLILP